MIRARGENATGQAVILLVLEPANVRRMHAGDPLTINLVPLLPDDAQAAFPKGLQLLVDACQTDAEFRERVAQLSRQAVVDGGQVNVFAGGPKGAQ